MLIIYFGGADVGKFELYKFHKKSYNSNMNEESEKYMGLYEALKKISLDDLKAITQRMKEYEKKDGEKENSN